MLRLGTRGSRLARTQSGHVVDALRRLDGSLDVETVVIATDDTAVGDKTRFVSAIERSLGAEEIDFAVHSAKDLPGDDTPGLVIAAVPPREDPSDVLLGAESLHALREGAVVGTSSLRRAAQLLAARPDLEVRPLRGNVDTRLGKLAGGEYDAIVLAAAGLKRLGAGDDVISAELTFVTAPGQGCLALQAREGDAAVAALAPLSDPASHSELTAERAVAAGLAATCNTPIGVNARVEGDGGGDGANPEMTVRAWIGLPDGSEYIEDEVGGPAADAEALGRRLAERMRAAGAGELLAAAEEMAA